MLSNNTKQDVGVVEHLPAAAFGWWGCWAPVERHWTPLPPADSRELHQTLQQTRDGKFEHTHGHDKTSTAGLEHGNNNIQT